MNETVEEREYKVLEIVSGEEAISQRKIASKLGFSLGLTNLIIKNLMRKGYIKIVGLNRKKVKYILTPKGFKEKARKSSKYILKTIREFLKYKDRIQRFIFRIYEDGIRNVEIRGSGELVEVLKIVLRSIELDGLNYKIFEEKREAVIIFDGKEVKLHELVSGKEEVWN